LKQGELAVTASSEGKWYSLLLDDIKLMTEYIFIELEGDTEIELSVTTDQLPGVVSVMRKDNMLPNVRDYDTLEMMEYEWIKLGMPLKLRKYSTASMKNISYTPCFYTEPALEMYSGDQAVNGYIRPYKSPNIWVSKGNIQEFIELNLGKKEKINTISITFNSNLNFRIRNVKPYDFSVMPEIVKDYRVQYQLSNGPWKTIKEVSDNYKRFNSFSFDPIEASRIRFEFLETNGADYIGVYNISVY